MKPYYALLLLSLFASLARAQYKNDNVAFKTVYLEDLCRELKNNPGYLLLDVRSPGEHHDTSSYTNLNIGRLQKATNIDIRELPGRIKDIESYRDKPIFVYCSHSQRSRRVSKMLSDSGFSKVYNINGGLTMAHLRHDLSCPQELIETNLPYKIITPAQLASEKEGNYTIVDIRSDSVFRGIATNPRQNAPGRFVSAVNIPLSRLPEEWSKINSQKNILLVDDAGNESPKAAKILRDKGFKNVFVLFNGMDGWIHNTEQPSPAVKWTSAAPYKMITSDGFDQLMKNKQPVYVFDVRSQDEFANRSKESWRNIGHIKNAINMPVDELKNKVDGITISKDPPMVVYSLGSSPDVFEAAQLLSAKGYDVHVLLGGLSSLRWKAANLKGKSHLKDWVVNVPAENL